MSRAEDDTVGRPEKCQSIVQQFTGTALQDKLSVSHPGSGDRGRSKVDVLSAPVGAARNQSVSLDGCPVSWARSMIEGELGALAGADLLESLPLEPIFVRRQRKTSELIWSSGQAPRSLCKHYVVDSDVAVSPHAQLLSTMTKNVREGPPQLLTP